MKDDTKRALQGKVSTKEGEVKVDIAFSYPTRVVVRHWIEKAMDFISWIEHPAQLKLEFDSAVMLADCTIKADKPIAKHPKGSNARSEYSFTLTGKLTPEIQNTLYNLMQGGRDLTVSLRAQPKKAVARKKIATRPKTDSKKDQPPRRGMLS